MHKALKKLEHLVDRLITPLLVVLLGVIILEFFFKEVADAYHGALVFFEAVLITTFILDLSFKYYRTRDWGLFLKRYWIDIIVILPFYYMLKPIEGLLRLTTTELAQSQAVLHASVEVSKEAGAFVQTAQQSRLHAFSKYLKPISRIPRFLKAFHFYERPLHK